MVCQISSVLEFGFEMDCLVYTYGFDHACAQYRIPLHLPERAYCISQAVSICVYIKKVNQSHYRHEVPRGFQEVKVPRLRDSGPGLW